MYQIENVNTCTTFRYNNMTSFNSAQNSVLYIRFVCMSYVFSVG